MAEDAVVNWAVVGLGDIVRKRVGLAIRRQANSTLYACVTRDPAAKRSDIETLAPRSVYTRLDEMLCDEGVDAVYLATPVYLHAAQAIASLKAGKDVVVEKPMALDACEAAEMFRVAEQSGRRLTVAYYRRFWPRFQFVKDMLDRGALGQVVSVRMALEGWYRPAAGSTGAWRTQRALSGGGVVSDVGSHRLDLLAWWFGLPRRLVARAKTITHDYEVEDSACVLMEINDGASVVASFHWNSKVWADEFHIVGTHGRVALVPCDGPGVSLVSDRGVEHHDIPKPENHHFPLIDDFAGAVIENRSPKYCGADGMKATQMIDAIYESSRKGGWQDVA